MQKINNFLELTRAWSLPISIFSCLLPFCWAAFDGGNLLYGILAIIGVIFAHLAANLADDFFDYKKIVKDFGINFDREKLGLQSEKCRLISNGTFSINQVCIISLSLFLIAFLIGLFFTFNVGNNVIYIAVITFLLSVLYSKFTYIGLGEIVIGLIFCPLLYMGIYYVMTGEYSTQLLLISFAVMPILIGVLYNHTMLDFDFDSKHNKITLCSILGSRQKAFKLLCFFELAPFFIISFLAFFNQISSYFFFVVLALPYAFCVLYLISHVLNEKPADFFKYFKPPMKLLVFFTVLLIISKAFQVFVKL